MSEKEGYEPSPLEDLLAAIKKDAFEEVEEIMDNLEPDVQLNEGYVQAAETLGNPEIVEAVLLHVSVNGLNPPHDYPTQLHWAISKGFKISAFLLAGVLMVQDRAERDSSGKTVLDLAREKGYLEVTAAIEDWDDKNK